MPKQKINVTKGSLFALAAALFFSGMVFFAKLAAPSTNTNMIIFFRFSISFLYILIILTLKTSKSPQNIIKTIHLRMHLLRFIFAFAGLLSFYFSLKFISLVNANLLFMTNALFIPIIATIVFRIKIHLKHWIALIIGFIGVILVLKPTHEMFNPKSLYALLSGFLVAIAIIVLRKLLLKNEDQNRCLFYYAFFSFLFSVIIASFNWLTPSWYIFYLLVISGILGSFYQHLLVLALKYTHAKIVSCLMYVSLIFSVFLGLIFFNEIPDLYGWMGIVLVCLGSILVVQFARKSLI